MPQIRIETQRVREVGRRLIAEGDRVAEIGRALQDAVGSLDTAAWDGASRARAEPLLGRAHPGSARVAEQLDALGNTLVRVADVFEEEDSTAARNLAGMAWVEWDAGGGAVPTPTFNPDDGDPDFGGVKGAETAEYGPVIGQPFIAAEGDAGDIDPNDITQGRIGDCYLMAALAEVAHRNPEAIRRMIRENGDGTYTVTLYERADPLSMQFQPVELVVTPDFPLKDGVPLFARPGDAGSGGVELWPMLVEKAYARHRGGYDHIQGGWGHTAMETITGVPSDWSSTDAVSLGAVADHFEQGHGLTASSLHDREIRIGDEQLWDIPDASDRNPLYQEDRGLFRLVEDHEYYITSVDRAAGTVTVANPWGATVPQITLSFEEFQGAFQRVSVNPLVH